MNTPRRATRWLRRLLGIVAAMLIGWLLAEILLRAAFEVLPARIQGDIQAVRRVPWSPERIVPEFAFIGDRDFQARLPVGMVDFPVRWSDARFTVSTISAWEGHRAGLRSDPPRYPLDIITFGDSYTFCFTAFADCWANRLSLDHGWHTFNAGNPGTGTTGQLRLLKELAPPMKPKVVIWAWFNNDLKDDYDLARMRSETEPLQSAPYPDPPLLPSGLGQYSVLAHLLTVATTPPTRSTPYQHYAPMTLNNRTMLMITNEYPHPDSLVWPVNQYGLNANKAAHAEAARFLRDEVGAKLVIVFIPAKEDAYSTLLIPTHGAEYLQGVGEGRRQLLAHCQSLAAAYGVLCIDPLPALKSAVEAGQTVYYAFDNHLDPVGNRLLEDIVSRAVIEGGLLPAKP
jgi:hypothetical protein